jgi:type IV pilus assembly protein PilC
MVLLAFILELLGWLLLWLVPNAVALWLVYVLLSLPLSRQEKARFFLELIEGFLRQGKTPEQGIVALAHTRDPSLGVRFRSLAGLIESGQSLAVALDHVPGLLPARVRGLLQAGCIMGDLRRVLPACRRVTSDALSAVQGATNYVVLTLLALSPLAAGLLGFLVVFVFPKFLAIAEDMEVAVPTLLLWLTRNAGWIAAGLLALCLCVYLAVLLYLGGPYLERWIRRNSLGLWDRLSWVLPWKRRRLLRDYVALLVLMLDGGMPEAEAVALAGEAVNHGLLRRRVRRAGRELAQGRPLPEALRHLDDSGDFRWRMQNAAAGQGGFQASLEGWLESLDARAYQQEQMAAQLTTTSLVLVNGALVGLIVIAVYQPLIAVMQAATLW